MLFRSSAVAAVATFASSALARDYTIDPDSVPIAEREQWCETELSTCPIICEQTEPGNTVVNTCDAESLTYGCLCGDNRRPNVSEYSLTLPYFVCREWGTQCVEDCPDNDSACASSCREDNPCGALDPVRVTSTASTASMEATASATDDDGTTIYTGSPGGDEEESSGGSSSSSGDDDNAGVSLLAMGRTYGLATVLFGMFMGFAVL